MIAMGNDSWLSCDIMTECPRCNPDASFWTPEQLVHRVCCDESDPCVYRKRLGGGHVLEDHDMIAFCIERLQRAVVKLERTLAEHCGAPEMGPWQNLLTHPNRSKFVIEQSQKILLEAQERLQRLSGYYRTNGGHWCKQRPRRRRTRDITAVGGGILD
jgi:hypothetical protein